MTTLNSSLLINGLELSIHLGWPNKERQHQQTVLLDITLTFPTPPLACQTDRLDDTLCYSTLAHQLLEQFSLKNFHLIEHLAKALYDFIMHKMPAGTLVTLQVTKHPAMPGLVGFVRFSYGDKS